MSLDDYLKVGYTIVLADALAIGDLCYLDKPKDGRVYVHKLHEWQVASFEGQIYRLEPGLEPCNARIKLVTKEELD